MPKLDWLTATPIAHRGLHNAAAGIIENTASAVAAAIAGGYGIEVDLQISADGEAMVHHDDALGRLTEGTAALAALPSAAIQAAPFRATADRIMTLGGLCDLVADRATLLLELKSRFDGDGRLPVRVAKVLAGYRGPVAAMSFDPGPVEALRTIAPSLMRGIVAERQYAHHAHHHWNGLSAAAKRRLAFLLHAHRTRPHFVAYAVRDLPAVAPALARLLGLPLLAWTVRSDDEHARAARYADQMIFEGFRP
jgi:glycerophosphoryl diester phosphodiesterase